MGYGPITNGKQGVITPWLGSWGEGNSRQCCMCGRQGHLAKDCKWSQPQPDKQEPDSPLQKS